MKVLVFVPSRNRSALFEKNTYRWLKGAGLDYKVVLERSQVAKYGYVAADKVLELQQEGLGLGYATHMAQVYAKAEGYDAVFKLDDDITRFNHRYYHVKKDYDEETEQRTQEFCHAYDRATLLLESNPRVGAVGFPYRNQLQNTKPVLVNKKLQTAYLVRMICYNPDPAFQSQEDYVTYINVRKAGYDVLRLNLYGLMLALPVGGGTGGIQDFDRPALAKKEMADLRKMYPGLVFKYKPDRLWKYEIDFSKSKF